MKMTVELTCNCGNSNKYDVKIWEDYLDLSDTMDDEYFKSKDDPSGTVVRCLNCHRLIEII